MKEYLGIKYFIIVCENNFYQILFHYEKDIVIWRENFGTDRNNLPKGMVQLKFK